MSGSKSSSPGAAAESPAPGDEPLTMTVHSLPSPAAQLAHDAAATRRGRWKMLLLLLICASPVIASYFTFYVIRPEGRSNYGELIDPPRDMPAIRGVDAEGRVVELAALKDQWLFLSVADSACDARCETHLYLQRQIRESLGKDKDRVDWVWLRTGSAELAEPLREATRAAVVLHMEEADIATWLAPAPGQRLADHLYVIDPMGRWMMRFPPNADPARMRRDWTRLLRASSFWDQPGR
jgi:hypothetical protein